MTWTQHDLIESEKSRMLAARWSGCEPPTVKAVNAASEIALRLVDAGFQGVALEYIPEKGLYVWVDNAEAFALVTNAGSIEIVDEWATPAVHHTATVKTAVDVMLKVMGDAEDA